MGKCGPGKLRIRTLFTHWKFCNTFLWIILFLLFWLQRSEVFYKKMSLKILQNSQENTCARVSILIKWQDWGSGNGLWHESFPVNIAKFSRAPFLQNRSRQLALSVPDIPYFSLLLFLTEKFLYFTELKTAFLWNGSKYISGHSFVIKWHR